MIGVLVRLSLVLVSLTSASAALALDYPTRSIRLIVPAAAGGPTFITARLLADRMQEYLGQAVIVEPHPGGGGNIGAEFVAKSEPDGYTILMATIGTHAINQTLYKKLSYDPIKDFVPVSQVVQYPLVLVINPSLPVTNVKELIEYARAHPGELNRASGGSGTSMHLSGELFVHQAGIDAPHIPYSGSAPALTDLVGNHVQIMFDSLITAWPLAKSGLLRALAVTGEQRSSVAPNLPTIAESGLPGYSAYGWIGVVAPARTPPEIVEKLYVSIKGALENPELRKRLIEEAAEPVGSSPDEFAKFIRNETDKWAHAVRDAGISVE